MIASINLWINLTPACFLSISKFKWDFPQYFQLQVQAYLSAAALFLRFKLFVVKRKISTYASALNLKIRFRSETTQKYLRILSNSNEVKFGTCYRYVNVKLCYLLCIFWFPNPMRPLWCAGDLQSPRQSSNNWISHRRL